MQIMPDTDPFETRKALDVERGFHDGREPFSFVPISVVPATNLPKTGRYSLETRLLAGSKQDLFRNPLRLGISGPNADRGVRNRLL